MLRRRRLLKSLRQRALILPSFLSFLEGRLPCVAKFRDRAPRLLLFVTPSELIKNFTRIKRSLHRSSSSRQVFPTRIPEHLGGIRTSHLVHASSRNAIYRTLLLFLLLPAVARTLRPLVIHQWVLCPVSYDQKVASRRRER